MTLRVVEVVFFFAESFVVTCFGVVVFSGCAAGASDTSSFFATTLRTGFLAVAFFLVLRFGFSFFGGAIGAGRSSASCCAPSPRTGSLTPLLALATPLPLGG